MTVGLTKKGNCKPSCPYVGIGSKCSHPKYTKAVLHGLKCPEDERTTEQIVKDIIARKDYFKNKDKLTSVEKQLDVLTTSEAARKKYIEKLIKKRNTLNLSIRTYESTYEV